MPDIVRRHDATTGTVGCYYKELAVAFPRNDKKDKIMRRDKGFTLVELTVVLVIISIMATIGMGALSAFLVSVNYSATKKKQDVIKDALVAYFGANKRLSCPETGSAARTGLETAPCDVLSAIGTIPYTTLGLPSDAAEDGWGNLFTYRPYTDDGNNCATDKTKKNWSSVACYGAGKVGGITLKDGASTVQSNLVAVIISHGSNGFGARNRNGVQNPLPSLVTPICDEAYNAPGTLTSGCDAAANTVFKGEKATENGNDDVVATLSANDIFIPLAKQGALKTAATRVSEDLQSAYDYSRGLLVTGSSSCSSITLPAPTNGETGIGVDPWGSAYTAKKYDSSGDFISGSAKFTSSVYQIKFCTPGCTGCAPPVPEICREFLKTNATSYRTAAGLSGC